MSVVLLPSCRTGRRCPRLLARNPIASRSNSLRAERVTITATHNLPRKRHNSRALLSVAANQQKKDIRDRRGEYRFRKERKQKKLPSTVAASHSNFSRYLSLILFVSSFCRYCSGTADTARHLFVSALRTFVGAYRVQSSTNHILSR